MRFLMHPQVIRQRRERLAPVLIGITQPVIALIRPAGDRIELRSKEYALLELLMRNAHRPMTRNMIIEHVWDIHFDSATNVIDVHINSLRNKIDKNFSPSLIHTIRGVGYQLTDKGE
jgi:DNA-binding response OmpR family regulator